MSGGLDPKALGRVFRAWRRGNGWTRADLLAEVIMFCEDGPRWTEQTVKAVENGTRTLTLAEFLIAQDSGLSDTAVRACFTVWGPPFPQGRESWARPASEAEQKAARKLGVTTRELREASLSLFGRFMDAERDARTDAKHHPDSARTRQAVRGHVTRQIQQELAEHLADAYSVGSAS